MQQRYSSVANPNVVWELIYWHNFIRLPWRRDEDSTAGLLLVQQLRVRFVPAAQLSMLRAALALQCVSKALVRFKSWSPLTYLISATNRHCWRSSEPVLMQRRSSPSQVLLFCAVLCCCAVHSAPAPSPMYYSPLPCRCQWTFVC
jgi:hypothetical protein